MEPDRRIVCIFCGGRADIKKQNNLKVVSCPKCKRETELNTYHKASISLKLSRFIKSLASAHWNI
jgi:hypothetical protein